MSERELAVTKTPSEWAKIRNDQIGVKWYCYNALKRLSEAISKNNKLEIDIWRHIAKELMSTWN